MANQNTWDEFYESIHTAAQADRDAFSSLQKLHDLAQNPKVDDYSFQTHVRELAQQHNVPNAAIEDLIRESVTWRATLGKQAASDSHLGSASLPTYTDIAKKPQENPRSASQESGIHRHISDIHQKELLAQVATMATGNFTEEERQNKINQLLDKFETSAYLGDHQRIFMRSLEQLPKFQQLAPAVQQKLIMQLQQNHQIKGDVLEQEAQETKEHRERLRRSLAQQVGYFNKETARQLVQREQQRLNSSSLALTKYHLATFFSGDLAFLYQLLYQALEGEANRRESHFQIPQVFYSSTGGSQETSLGGGENTAGQSPQTKKSSSIGRGARRVASNLAKSAVKKVAKRLAREALKTLAEANPEITIPVIIIAVAVVAALLFIVVVIIAISSSLSGSSDSIDSSSTPLSYQTGAVLQNAQVITSNLCRTDIKPGNTLNQRCDSATYNLYDNINPQAQYPQPQKILSFSIGSYIVANRPYTYQGQVRPYGRYWCTDLVIDSYAAAGFKEISGWTNHQPGPYYLWNASNVRPMVIFFQTVKGYAFIPVDRFRENIDNIPPGSPIFFEWNGGEHVGIVQSIHEDHPGYGTITTYEANSWTKQGYYSFREYTLGNSIVGFGIKTQ